MHDGVGLGDVTILWSYSLLKVYVHPCSVRKPKKLTGLIKLDFDEVVIWLVVGAHQGDWTFAVCLGKELTQQGLWAQFFSFSSETQNNYQTKVTDSSTV